MADKIVSGLGLSLTMAATFIVTNIQVGNSL